MAETDGADERSQSPFLIKASRISQLKVAWLSRWYSSIFCSSSGDVFLFLLPPIEPGLIDPVSWYLEIFLSNCVESKKGEGN